MTPEERKAKLDEIKRLEKEMETMRNNAIERAQKVMSETGMTFTEALESLYKKKDSIYIWHDWSSTALWVLREGEPKGVGSNAAYENYGIAADLRARFEFWTSWHDAYKVEYSDEKNNFDRELYDAYGTALAIELKLFLGDKHRVFYHDRLNPNCFEITLVKNFDGVTVPMTHPYVKN